MTGEPIENAHPIIRMFVLCESMKWATLPVAGGIYDQSPVLLDGFMKIFSKRAEHEEQERKKSDAEMKRKAKGR